MGEFIEKFQFNNWNGKFYPNSKPENDQLEIYIDGKKITLTMEEKSALVKELKLRRERRKKAKQEQENPIVTIYNHTSEGENTYKIHLQEILIQGVDKFYTNNQAGYKDVRFEMYKIDRIDQLPNVDLMSFVARFFRVPARRRLDPSNKIYKLCFILGADKHTRVLIRKGDTFKFAKEEVLEDYHTNKYGVNLDFTLSEQVIEELLIESNELTVKRVGESYVVSFPYSKEVVSRVKEIAGYSWNPDKKVWTFEANDETREELELFIKEVAPLPGIPAMLGLVLLKGESCDAPTYPTSWNHIKKQYVATISHEGDREYVSERENFTSKKKNADLVVGNYHQPENLLVGSVIEVKAGSYKNLEKIVYRKDTDGWKLLGHDLDGLIRKGLAMFEQSQAQKFSEEELKNIVKLLRSGDISNKELGEMILLSK